MIKIIPPGSYNFDDETTRLIKLSSRGLIGADLSSFIKRAGHKMADIVRNLEFNKGDTPIHLIALGDTERYGCNRNGDGFSEETCKTYHNTFVKNARFYRSHNNKDKSKSYGIIKHSMYNNSMHRIELVVALNGNKEAAERNKGLVADEELKKLASNEDFPVSMACSVAYDVCSMCGNKAKTRDDYCDEDDCSGGGCKENLCKVAEDGRITYVDNPAPRFFDLSRVYKPADRIAFIFGELDLEKQASKRVLGGAQLANMLNLSEPLDFIAIPQASSSVQQQIKIALELASLTPASKLSPTSLQGINKIAQDTRSKQALLHSLANEKIAMSFSDFVQLTTSVDKTRADAVYNEIAPYLPNTFKRLTSDLNKLAEALKTNPFKALPSSTFNKWAKDRILEGSLEPLYVRRRACLSVINEEKSTLCIKQASTQSPIHENLCDAYGLYTLNFLYEVGKFDSNFDLTKQLIISQNYR